MIEESRVVTRSHGIQVLELIESEIVIESYMSPYQTTELAMRMNNAKRSVDLLAGDIMAIENLRHVF